MILSGLIRAATPENPRFDINSAEAWETFTGGPRSSSGESVSRDKALTYAPWWRGINLVSNSVARLPLLVYQRQEAGKKTATNHPAWPILRRRPNAYMGAFDFKKTLIAHALQQGNGYAYVSRFGDGRPAELLILDPDCTYPVRVDGELWYLTDVDGEQRKLDRQNVLHIRGLSPDGMIGYSVFDKARESLGLGLATRKFGSVFFRNNARPNVAIEVPSKYDEKAQSALRAGWERVQGGLDNAHRVAILWGGSKLQTYSINAQDAQLLETRQFEIREIALWIGIPPHKLGDASKASYNSLEQENQDYLEHGLEPWLCPFEEECYDKLLSEIEKQQETHEILFDRKRLLAGDRATRGAYFARATGGRAWMTPDEARDEEDLELLGGDASELLDPLNMGKPGSVVDDSTKSDDPAPPKRSPNSSAVAVVVADASWRMVRRLSHAAESAAKKPAEFLQWLDGLHDAHIAVIREALDPAAKLIEVSAESMAAEVITLVRAELLQASGLCTPAQLAGVVEREMRKLESVIPGQIVSKFWERTP